MRKLVSQFCKALAVFAIFLSQCSMTPTIKNEGAKSLANYIKDLGYTKFKVYLSRTRLGHIIDESNQLTGAKIVTGKLVIHNTNQSMKLSYNTSNYAGLGADIPILGSAKIDYSSIYKIDVELVNIKKYELDSKKLNPSYASIESYRKKPFIVSLLFAEKILVRAYSQVGGKLKLEPKLLSSVNLRRDKSGTSLIGARNAFIGYITQKEVGDIRHVSLLKSHDPLNEQPGGAPGWISGAIGINKQGKR
ncbi:MAG: hypothetical protein OEZ36_11515, partial [Spirochaetota bacterium]|nr:hypothetical protein [Spirochaetota bacterium]